VSVLLAFVGTFVGVLCFVAVDLSVVARRVYFGALVLILSLAAGACGRFS
jgi:hypothetical protein